MQVKEALAALVLQVVCSESLMKKITYKIPKIIPQGIFRTYDIRGVVEHDITVDVIYAIARGIGYLAHQANQSTMVIGRDGRLSSDFLWLPLKQGLLDSGIDVIDIGLVPTPLLYFATSTWPHHSGVMLTASHNPANYNGLKIVMDGKNLSEQQIENLYQCIIEKKFIDGQGQYRQQDIIHSYLDYVRQDINLTKPLKIAIDCGNAVTGIIAPKLFSAFGCEVTQLYCELDGRFPNHHPDPSEPHNLQALQQVVIDKQLDVGLAFDGDGDRVGIVTNRGDIIFSDRQIMLLAKDVLQRYPGEKIIFDVKCTNKLADLIKQYDGEPIMWKTGHSLIKNKMKDTQAILAGEMSGHIFFRERWFGFDDGMYTGARILEILSQYHETSDEVFKQLPTTISTPELKLPIREEDKQHFMQQLTQQAHFPDANYQLIDGLRVNFADGWGLIRPSNTSPNLILRFEGDDDASLQRIQALFRQQILQLYPEATLPF